MIVLTFRQNVIVEYQEAERKYALKLKINIDLQSGQRTKQRIKPKRTQNISKNLFSSIKVTNVSASNISLLFYLEKKLKRTLLWMQGCCSFCKSKNILLNIYCCIW